MKFVLCLSRSYWLVGISLSCLDIRWATHASPVTPHYGAYSVMYCLPGMYVLVVLLMYRKGLLPFSILTFLLQILFEIFSGLYLLFENKFLSISISMTIRQNNINSVLFLYCLPFWELN